jgi:uncharacterized protein
MSRSLDTDTVRPEVVPCGAPTGRACQAAVQGEVLPESFVPPKAARREPPRDITVRPATEADHPAILTLLRELELGYVAQHLPSFLVVEGRSGGGAPAVFGVAELKEFGGDRLLSSVGVREDLQGLGLGRVLVERVLAGVADDVWLYTLIPGFFAKLGFVEDDAPPARLPPRRIYGCDACTPERCHRMVRRRREGKWGQGKLGQLRGETVPEVPSASAPRNCPSLPCPPGICDLAPAALRIWRDCEAPSVREIEGAVCIRLDSHHEAPYFLEPTGEGDLVAALDACLRETGRVSRVRAGLARRLAPDRFAVAPLRDHFDYVCDVREIAALRGAKHDGKRNQIRKFAREHPRHEVRALAAADRGLALALFDRWGLGRAAAPSPPSLPDRTCQRRAIERAFEEFDALSLTGAAVTDDGALLGFLVASRVGDTAFAHFLYADAAAPGVYQTLLVEACRTVLSGATWVNLEEDLGLPGLRRTKLSWQPARLLEKYEVTLRSA